MAARTEPDGGTTWVHPAMTTQIAELGVGLAAELRYKHHQEYATTNIQVL